MNEDDFRAQLAANGYGEAGITEWAPNSDGTFHTHDFSAMLLVTQGEFRLVLETGAQTFSPGQWCEVPSGTVHYEQSGPEGALVLAGRK